MKGSRKKPTWHVIKTYGHNLGLSCAFRQWRAKSHCRFIHGYALQVELVFATSKLDDRNWVIDFGGLSFIKKYLEGQFDHKTLVAKDDPALGFFKDMHNEGLIDMVLVDHVGCEKFAEEIFTQAKGLMPQAKGVKLVSVSVREHGSNAAVYGEG